MIELQIACHAQTHRVPFTDRATAQAELDKLIPLLGRDRWGSNGKDNEPTHIINTPEGSFVVVLEKVEAARLVDHEVADGIFEAEKLRADARSLDRVIEHRKRLQDSGVANVT